MTALSGMEEKGGAKTRLVAAICYFKSERLPF